MTVAITTLLIAGTVAVAARFAYSRGHVAGALANELANRNIVEVSSAEVLRACGGDRIRFTCYPSCEPVSIAPEMVGAVLPIEHDATAIALRNGLVVAVAERCELVEAVLK